MTHQPVPNSPAIRQFVLYVIAKLNEAGRRPSTIQLVKYLYLIDLEYQRNFHRTVTGFQWVFHYYGPYCFELPDLLESAGYHVQSETFSVNGYEGKTFTADYDIEFPKGLLSSTKSTADRIIKIWAAVETQDILEYVYFRTEPMIDARQGDVLDFDKVRPAEGNYDLAFSETKQLKAMKKRHEHPLELSGRVPARINPPVDEQFIDTMISLDKED